MGNNVFSPRLKYIFIFSILLFGMFLFWNKTRNYSSIVIVAKTPSLNKKISNWIVVTSSTVKSPSKDIEKLAKIKGWQVLVVGDLETPSNWSYPGCIFLGIDQQNELGFRVTSHLPTNSYTRKIIGYLFAIQNGARHIYDTDDNHPSNGNIKFYQQQFTSGLIYDDFTDDVMNPYAHFGQPSIWPRGFPLDRTGKSTNNTYKLCTFKTPAIQHGLVNGDPDVDAIYRLTRKLSREQHINVTFDVRAPPVTLPQGVFASFNSQNTFFAYDAFWSLFLPTSVTSRVTDIWRSYWAQRLLWLLGQRLSFFPPDDVQFRNSRDYLEDFQDENQLYLETSNLIDFLKKWKCSESNFFTCISHLAHKMAAASFWKDSDAELIDLWLADLVAIGYRQPKMGEITNECLKIGGNSEKGFRVYLRPADRADLSEKSGLSDINHLCNNAFNISMEMTDAGVRVRPKIIFDDVLLVIVFNFPFYQLIHFLDALYYEHFPNIAYCGQTPSFHQFINETEHGPFPWRQRQGTFINITISRGYFAYECGIRAMEMGYNVNGYLIMADDMLFNLWNFEKIRHEDVSQMQLEGYRTINRTSGPTKWMWWGSHLGKKPLEKSLAELKSMAEKNTDKMQKKLVSQYLNNLSKASLNMTIMSLGLSDLYYVPRSASPMFREIMKVFLKNKVFLEIAVPTTMAGLNPNVSTVGFAGKSLWGGARKTPYKHFNTTKHFVHPIKLSKVFMKADSKKDYCETYVSQLFQNW